MAGIGFELKKLFAGRGMIMKIRAYAYASIVCSGTMLLAIVLLLGVQSIANVSGVSEVERERLVVMMVYAMLLSLLLTSGLQMLLSRYVADQLYQDSPERVLPSLFGASLLIMVPGGMLYALFLAQAPEIALVDRALNWLLFMLLIPVWLQMSYITAAKDYKRILYVFALGIGAALGLGCCFIALGLRVTTSLMAAMATGYGIMLVGFMRVLLRYFPAGSGSPFAFTAWFNRTPSLLAIGFFNMAGAFAHMILMWFSPLGEPVAGWFRQAASHDAASFFAYLVTVPTSINFIVSVEVNFYQKYRDYFSAITDGGTLSEITLARTSMATVLHQEIFKISSVQIFCMVAYAVLMRYFLELIGFTTEMIAMFQIMVIGYSGYAVGNSLMLLQLYFNDRRGALFTTIVFFLVNSVSTAILMNVSSLYYGVGFALAGGAIYLAALPRLIRYVNRIDYHVFCEQPVLNREKKGFWISLAAWLDRRAGTPKSVNQGGINA